MQELEEQLKENNMKWDVIGLGEVRRKEKSFTTLQSGHLLYHSEANNGGFLVDKKCKDNITRVSSGSSRVAELVLRITDRYQLKIVQVYAPTTSHSGEETDNFYNTIDKILEKQTHYTIVMGDFNAEVGGQTNTSERATGCFGLGQRNERGDTLVEWATSNNFKIMNTQFQKKEGRRWTWRSPDGHTKNEIDYIMTDSPSMVTDVTVINRINIGSDHSMAMGSITLNTRTEGRKLLNKNTRTSVDTQMIETKKNTQPKKNGMVTVLDKQGKQVQEQDKIMERIEEFYSELYESDQAVTIQTDPEEVPPIMAWEVEAALRKMKNGKEAGKIKLTLKH